VSRDFVQRNSDSLIINNLFLDTIFDPPMQEVNGTVPRLRQPPNEWMFLRIPGTPPQHPGQDNHDESKPGNQAEPEYRAMQKNVHTSPQGGR
jgi:hypothetical protein